jgi:hypothetical protein
VTDLRNQFQLDDRFKQMANQRIERIISGLDIQNREDLVLVGVHFRGTDFAAIMKTTKKRQDVTEKFYGKAFDFYRKKFSDKKLLFLVVSDDPKMAKFVLKGKMKNIGENSQFYQHSMRSFYVRKFCAQLFCAYFLGLNFTGARLLAQKQRIEC